jgi:hypothetical protein
MIKTMDELLGKHCPKPDELRTGDLLFPRKGGAVTMSVAAQWHSNWFDKKISTVIRDTNPLLYRVISIEKNRKLLDSYSPGLRLQASPGMQLSTLLEKSGAQVIDLDDPKVQMYLYKVFSLAFKELIDAWLEMTIKQFIASSIGKFLLTTLTANDARDSFFVGHLSMVIREHNGQVVYGNEGQAYVIEANVTDYSHYRVAVHPYCPQIELTGPVPAENRALGWVTRRMAIGEKVWVARPGALPAGDQPDTNEQKNMKNRLVEQAKALHGRPYGFFDNPKFGDTDRVYCSEYLYSVFKSAAVPNFGEHRTWKWVQAYLSASGQDEVRQLVDKLMKDHPVIKPENEFFVLTPPMIWRSQALVRGQSPEHEDSYSPEVP